MARANLGDRHGLHGARRVDGRHGGGTPVPRPVGAPGGDARPARASVEMMIAIDVTGVLASVSVPTLVIQHDDDPLCGMDDAHDLIAGTPNARLVELPGHDHFLFSGDSAPILAAVEEFMVGASPGPVSRIVLATVLFADIVESTRAASDVGDARGPAGSTSSRASSPLPARAPRRAGRLRRRRAARPPRRPRPRRTRHLRCVTCWPGQAPRSGPDPRRGDRAAGSRRAGIGMHIASRIADVADPGSSGCQRTVTDLVGGLRPGVRATWRAPAPRRARPVGALRGDDLTALASRGRYEPPH